MSQLPTAPPAKYPHLSESIVRNLREKVRHFLALPKSRDATLKVVVYGDKEEITYRMWNSIFHEDVNFVYSKDVELTPTPPGYSREMYDDYESETRQVVADYVRDKGLDIIWDLYDVSTLRMYPRMHLLLANRRIQRTEFGQWAGVDRRGNWLPVPASKPWMGQSGSGSLSEFSRAVGAGGGSAPASPLRRSLRISSRKHRRTDRTDVSGSSSAGGSTAGSSSAGGSSASLSSGAHNDRRFIAVESLRSLVSTVMKVGTLPKIKHHGSSSSSSTGASSSSRSRQSSRGLPRSATCASIASMTVESEAESSAQSSTEPPAESSAESEE